MIIYLTHFEKKNSVEHRNLNKKVMLLKSEIVLFITF